MTSMNGTINRRAVLARVSSAGIAGFGLVLLPSAVEAAPLGPIGKAPDAEGIDGSVPEQAQAVVVLPRRRRRVCWWRRGRRVCAWR